VGLAQTGFIRTNPRAPAGRWAEISFYFLVCRRWNQVYIVAINFYIREYKTAKKLIVEKKTYIVAEKVNMV
jgi:hypothetical protein